MWPRLGYPLTTVQYFTIRVYIGPTTVTCRVAASSHKFPPYLPGGAPCYLTLSSSYTIAADCDCLVFELTFWSQIVNICNVTAYKKSRNNYQCANYFFSSFLRGMSYMPSCGVRRPSVRPSVCKHLRKSLVLPGKGLDREQTHSFDNLPFPFSVPFSSALQSPNGCSVSSAMAHIVKQFVKLFVQYGLTFCLSVRTVYEAPIIHPLKSRLCIRQLNLMSKCWNELYSVIDGLFVTYDTSVLYNVREPVYDLGCR